MATSDTAPFVYKHIYYGLLDTVDTSVNPNTVFFTEEQFEIVLGRVKENRIGIYLIEALHMPEGATRHQLYDITTFESSDSSPLDPEWYYSAFEKYKALGMDFKYRASLYVPGNAWV